LHYKQTGVIIAESWLVVVRLRDDGPTAMPHKPTLIDLHRSSSAGVRILLADDFAPWRSQVRSFLQSETKWKIVFEACDGLEAVQKTVELRPDIVLLDISMPGLNGIEAASRIRQRSPDSRIIILTQNADEDLMTAALARGRCSGLCAEGGDDH
jgi:CheY-like chemotaxis protein